MKTITNNYNLSLSMSVWLANNEYTSGVNPYPEYEMISVSSLIQPTRQFILSQRVEEADDTTDLTDLIPSRMGHAMHSSKEEAWKNYKKTLKTLGYPDSVIDKFVINPTEPVKDDEIGVYLENRSYRLIDDVCISGQYDEVINNEINDTKTTSVYAYINGSNNDNYTHQMSSYRWLNPELITSDIARIQHIFTDWQRSGTKTNPNYPPHKAVEKVISLMSLENTEAWISSRIKAIRDNIDLSQEDMVRCTREELWMSDPVYKYYSDPAKAKEGGRSTKNFDSLAEANQQLIKTGKGIVITVEGEPKRCAYCPAMPICLQAMEMLDARP